MGNRLQVTEQYQIRPKASEDQIQTHVNRRQYSQSDSNSAEMAVAVVVLVVRWSVDAVSASQGLEGQHSPSATEAEAGLTFWIYATPYMSLLKAIVSE